MIHHEMSAAFPPKLSGGAEKLRDRLNSIAGWTDARLAPSVSAQGVAGLIVSELGITPEMVESLHNTARIWANEDGDLPEMYIANKAADALATLLEVAGRE